MNQNTNVNVVPSYGQRGELHFSQYDVGRTATINLYGVNEAYSIPASSTVKIQATKPSGLGFNESCTYSGNVVTIVSTETMTEECGRFPCELQITKDSDVIGTANFMFCVKASPHPDGTVDGDAEEVINEIKALVLQSEGYALGTQNGVPVSSGSPYYENNSKWYSEHPVGGGISDAVKQALLDCFENVVWINGDGQDYYDTLNEALYPPANLVSISAVYTQMGTVYDNQSLDSLKSNLVVTALYDDTTSATVPSTDYTLSGSLTTGTSTITVIYEGKTTTFDVTVTHATTQYTITNTLTECTNSNTASVINELTEYTGTLTANQGYIMSSVTITMGNTDITSTAYDSSDGSITIASVTGNIVITAEAILDVGWISGVPYDSSTFVWEDNSSISVSNGTISSSSAQKAVSTYLPCYGASAIKYETAYSSIAETHPRAFYDENYNFISGVSTFYTDVGESLMFVPSNAHYMRISMRKAEANAGITLTPYYFDEITESTVWEAGKIYRTTASQLGLCFGATTIKMLVDAGTYGIRGYYSLFDSAKQRTNSMSATNNFTRTPFAVNGNYYFSLSVNNVMVKLLTE